MKTRISSSSDIFIIHIERYTHTKGERSMDIFFSFHYYRYTMVGGKILKHQEFINYSDDITLNEVINAFVDDKTMQNTFGGICTRKSCQIMILLHVRGWFPDTFLQIGESGNQPLMQRESSCEMCTLVV